MLGDLLLQVVVLLFKHVNFLAHNLCLLLEEFFFFLFLLPQLFQLEPELVLDAFEGPLRFLFFFSYHALVHFHSLLEGLFEGFFLLFLLGHALFQPAGPCLELSDFLIFLVQFLQITFGAQNRFCC